MPNKTILLVDMNSFFASVHQAEDPALQKKPIIVGGHPNNKTKGMVIAASYEAKDKGVYTTMSVYEALKKCPEAIIVERNHSLYSNYSKKIMDFLRLIGPTETASIDEAYIDITERVRNGTAPKLIATYIQKVLWEKLKLGCSIGCSDTKTSAKMAADIKKPFGYVHLERLQFCTFFHPQELHKLHGCGKKTEDITLFTYFQDHAKLYKLLLSTHICVDFRYKMAKAIEQLFIEEYEYELEETTLLSTKWLYVYRSNGIAGLIIRWIEEDFSHSPEYMSQQIVALMLTSTEVFYVKNQ